MKKIFIISPYTHSNPEVVEKRYKETCDYFVHLMNEGQAPVSVIVACHHLIKNYDLAAYFSFWEDYCYQMMKDVDEVHALMLEGIEESVGAIAEIKKAIEIGKGVWYKYPRELNHE